MREWQALRTRTASETLHENGPFRPDEGTSAILHRRLIPLKNSRASAFRAMLLRMGTANQTDDSRHHLAAPRSSARSLRPRFSTVSRNFAHEKLRGTSKGFHLMVTTQRSSLQLIVHVLFRDVPCLYPLQSLLYLWLPEFQILPLQDHQPLRAVQFGRQVRPQVL